MSTNIDTSAPTVRKRIYELGLVLQTVVVFYGIASQEEAALWLALAGALYNAISLIIARVNVEKAPDARRAADHKP